MIKHSHGEFTGVHKVHLSDKRKDLFERLDGSFLNSKPVDQIECERQNLVASRLTTGMTGRDTTW